MRELRTAQGLTLAALAAQIGISASALSQIERGRSEPSLGTLWRLGGALRASLFDFFAHDRSAPFDVTPAGQRTIVEFERFRYEAIARSARRSIDLFVLRLEPGDGPVRDLVRHAGEEAGLVLEGSLEVRVADTAQILHEGDGIWFLSSEAHTFSNAGDGPCVSVWADTIPHSDATGDGGEDEWSHSLFDAAPTTRSDQPSADGPAPPAPARPAPRTPSAQPRRTAAGGGRGRTLERARSLPVKTRELREIVAELSAIGSRSDGFRVAGTAEDRTAATLISERLRAAGLQDVAIEETAVDGWRLGEARLTVDGQVIPGASLGGAPGTPPGGLTAPVVDVGTGERRRLDRVEVAGRIALLDWSSLSVSPAEVSLELAQRGAAATVVACFEGGPLYQAPGAVGVFDSHWYPEAGPVLTIAREPAAALRRRLRDGPLVGELTVGVELTRGAAGCNVVGWLPGTEPGAPIVIGAHHDAWFHGAFDNATGVAALIVLAAGLVQQGDRPRRSLCFTSRTGEEYGHAQVPFDWCAGAWAQVSEQHPDWRQSPFHLCLEASGHPGLRHIVEAPAELAGWARAACRAADREGWLTAGWRVGPPVTGTEQWPFLLAGVPGVASYCWETSFRRTRYHTALDTAAIVDFEHLARTVRLDALLLLEASRDPDALHDPRARERDLVRACRDVEVDTARLLAAARHHGKRRGRAAFSPVGRALLAVGAHGDAVYPHTQAARDAAQLDRALAALEAGELPATIRALEAVGANRLTRTLSQAPFARHLARRRPGAPATSWAQAGHLTDTPDLWCELASLRGEPGARPVGRWLAASLRRHRRHVEQDLRRRLSDMTRALSADPTETP